MTNQENHIVIQCFYERGSVILTGFNGTLEEARAYFMGNIFNVGFNEQDDMQKCVKVELD
jgi:hypothetical protein